MRPDQPDMNLPAGKTCSDCRHSDYCARIIGILGTETHCDWSPSKFIARVVEQQYGVDTGLQK